METVILVKGNQERTIIKGNEQYWLKAGFKYKETEPLVETKPVEPVVEPIVETESTESTESTEPVEISMKLKREELVEIAIGFGIEVLENATKEQIITLINEKKEVEKNETNTEK